MIKIFLTVRNRIAVTTKCITALEKHSTIPHQIYIYDNLTNYKIPEHFMYYSILYEKGIATQITFNTSDSTFGAFSKASACNQFGLLHEMDPHKDKFDFLVFLDNDIIVEPNWDEIILNAWNDIKIKGLRNIKVVGQAPGGITAQKNLPYKIGGFEAVTGKNGGSGFWTVKSNFFKDVGFLDLPQLIGFDKKHDQMYWRLLNNATNGNDYILGLKAKLRIHSGKIAGSVCNKLTALRGKPEKLEVIKFEQSENDIDKMSFDEFYEKIKFDKELENDW